MTPAEISDVMLDMRAICDDPMAPSWLKDKKQTIIFSLMELKEAKQIANSNLDVFFGNIIPMEN